MYLHKKLKIYLIAIIFISMLLFFSSEIYISNKLNNYKNKHNETIIFNLKENNKIYDTNDIFLNTNRENPFFIISIFLFGSIIGMIIDYYFMKDDNAKK
jgi:hypothetical protein